MDLTGKHAIVTGGGRGIGAAIADSLIAAGAKVTIMGRNLETLQEKAQGLTNCLPVACDITDEAAVKSAFDQARAAFGPVDILVNNAGAAKSIPFKKTDRAHFQQMIDVNLMGPYLCIQAVLQEMIDKGAGRIINVASTAALKGYGYVTAYSAAKHGVLGLTRSLALEVATKGVTVNAVCPGFTETDIARDAIKNIVAKTGRTKEQAIAELTIHNPQKRLIQPEEVAASVLWLCQDNAASITGQAIAVAGGEVM
ncbi:SDR family NAD(P)-dependent oxidoreductase [Paremcibacter congregatus]|uniref:SDR family NAD(P)-dependent oxidoreductase n=1 Tax=Paremcibacter congregatus TaxID=2043170 RepID=UPI003A927031